MSHNGPGHRACAAGWCLGLVVLTGLAGCHLLQSRDEKPAKASQSHTKIQTASAKGATALDSGWELPPASEVGLGQKPPE